MSTPSGFTSDLSSLQKQPVGSMVDPVPCPVFRHHLRISNNTRSKGPLKARKYKDLSLVLPLPARVCSSNQSDGFPSYFSDVNHRIKIISMA